MKNNDNRYNKLGQIEPNTEGKTSQFVTQVKLDET